MKSEVMAMWQGAEWIWNGEAAKRDHYVQFINDFALKKLDNGAVLTISCETNYAVWLNGSFVGAGQYHDYPENKAYDEYKVSHLLVRGRNRLAVAGYSANENYSWHVKSSSGVIYSLAGNRGVLASSGEGTLCREANDYISGVMPNISVQLGRSYRYDSRAADNWMLLSFNPAGKFRACVAVEKPCDFRPRPIKRAEITDEVPGEVIAQGVYQYPEGNGTTARRMQRAYLSHRLIDELTDSKERVKLPQAEGKTFIAEDGENIYLVIDLAREETGFLSLDVELYGETKIDIAFGEHLDDLRVRSEIDGRNFAVEFIGSAGRNTFRDCMRRLGLRYLQLHFHTDKFKLYYAGLRPHRYPVVVLPYRIDDALHQKIYDTSVRTLQLCMHEHYEDCPWREQSQYAMDARNQMLCGYYAFGEYAFSRAALCSMVERLLDNGNLPLCSPSGNELYIPCFSLVYFLALNEYTAYSQDITVLGEVYEKCERVMDSFLAKQTAEGLLPRLSGKDCWNFYEWEEGLANLWTENERYEGRAEFPLILNAFFSAALESYIEINEKLGRAARAADLRTVRNRLHKQLDQTFWNSERGLYCTYVLDGVQQHYCELGQSLMLYCGAVPQEKKKSVLQKLAQPDNGMVPVTLSYSVYKYDALLREGETYRNFVRGELERIWGGMLYRGATTFWETERGGDDFHYAGSLCHGWSAVPVYLYHKYKLVR